MRQDERVAAHVRALIEAGLRSGDLKPGDRLPFTQAELAEQLGVNKNSVFWGFAALRAEGVIIGVQGGRAVIPGPPAGSGPEELSGADASAEEEQTKDL